MSELSVRLRDEIEFLQAEAHYPQLVQLCKRALRAARKTEDREAETVALLGLAVVHRVWGKVHEAGIFGQGAIDQALSTGRNALVSDALIEQATHQLLSHQRYFDAQQTYRDALAAAIEEEYQRGITASLHGVAQAQACMGWWDQAERYGHEALDYARNLEAPYWISQALLVLGQAYRGQKRTEKAQECFEHALAISQQANLPTIECLARYEMAISWVDIPQMADAATAQLNLALDLAKTVDFVYGAHQALTGQGLIELRRANYAAAQTAFTQQAHVARELSIDSYQADALLNFGRTAHQVGDHEHALNHFSEALGLARQQENPHLSIRALEWLARHHSARQEYRQALAYLQEAWREYLHIEDGAGLRRTFFSLMLIVVLSGWHALSRLFGR